MTVHAIGNEAFEVLPSSQEQLLKSPIDKIESAKQAILGYATGHVDIWEKGAALAQVKDLSDDDLSTLSGDTDAQTLVAYTRLGIEPSDVKDVEGNLYRSWFESDEEYENWTKNYQTTSALSASPKWLKDGEVAALEDETEADDYKIFRSRKTVLGSGALIGATFAALAFEQSPGNESVRATAALEVLENTSDPIAAGIMVAGLTVVIEGVTGTLIAGGLNRERRVLKPKLERFRDKLVSDDSEDINEKGKLGEIVEGLTDTGITCTIGPGMVVARRHFQEDERTFGKDIKTLAGYTGVGAGVSGLIGYLATGGVKHADKVGLGTPAEYFVDYATDWKFWTGLLVTGYGGKWVVGKIKKLRNKNTTEKPELTAEAHEEVTVATENL